MLTGLLVFEAQRCQGGLHLLQLRALVLHLCSELGSMDFVLFQLCLLLLTRVFEELHLRLVVPDALREDL